MPTSPPPPTDQVETIKEPSPARDGDILVVDDNPSNLLAIEAALGDFASTLVQVRSGEEALRALLRQDFALILLDVQMPVMDGFETAKLIRTRGRTRHTPIIFITAFDQRQEQILQGYSLGAVDFLFKPIVPDVLRAKASVFVELRRRTAEVARQAELLREHERREHERQLTSERQRWEAEMLRRHNRELEEADHRKNEFLAMLAHELRTPLSPIVMALDLLRDWPGASGEVADTPAITPVLDTMERQLRHLTRLVDDLLEVSRITRGAIELRREPMAAQHAVAQAIAMCQPDLDARGHHLFVDVPPTPLWVEVDPVRLTQVMVNLIINAACYTDPGGRIEIRSAREDAEIVLSVRDNGHGIPAELIDRIFDMFVQGDRSSGLGLGLALVRRLVEMHGGRVAATSDGPGRGSQFVVRLPAAAPPAHAAVEVAPTAASAEPRRVVVVEDHDDIRDLLAAALRRRGHDVVTAANGEDGVRAIAKTRPDIALVDIGLPGIDGIEVARRARREVGRSTRLVAMTGFGQDAVRAQALAAGFDDFLVKPIPVGTVERILGGVAQPAPAAAVAQPVARPRGGDRLRVLIVEDDEDASDVLRAALERDGYEVASARDAEEAIRHARAWLPMVVLCDLALSGERTGLDVARALRADERTRVVRLVAVTGYSRPEDRKAAISAGFDDYLTKPLTLGAVKAAIQHATGAPTAEPS